MVLGGRCPRTCGRQGTYESDILYRYGGELLTQMSMIVQEYYSPLIRPTAVGKTSTGSKFFTMIPPCLCVLRELTVTSGNMCCKINENVDGVRAGGRTWGPGQDQTCTGTRTESAIVLAKMGPDEYGTGYLPYAAKAKVFCPRGHFEELGASATS